MKIVPAVPAIAVAGCTQSATPTPTPTQSPNVPCGPSEVFTRHEHAHLTLVLRGQLPIVPAFIGILATQICWLHTHDTRG